jgi:serine/threonine protein kinase
MSDTITQIGRYEISRQLVDTALASVYDAFDPVERKPVAIRVPRTTHHGTKEITLGLNHPGLMTVLSYEQSKGESFLVLEPFQGTPLASRLADGRKMDPVEVLGLLRQLASVLDYAHAHGSLHGSLHPDSILLNDRNEIKVLDLGAPATVGCNASPEQLLRAVHYLSPECIRDQPMDGRSDEFSLAVLAHMMLTGQLPFAGKPLGVMFRIAYQGLERDAIREFPIAAQTVLDRALSKRPMERYTTCGEMVEALSNALLRTPAAATRMVDAAAAPRSAAHVLPSPPSRVSRHFSREALKYFGVTFVICALALAGMLYFVLPKPRPKPSVPAPAPVVGVPVPGLTGPKPSAQPPKPQAKTPPASRPAVKKKVEPEVDVTPKEPRIIHQ